jgi:hypothetical protein
MVRMREVLQDLERSGLTQRAYAERCGVPLSTLTWWRRRLGHSVAGSRRHRPERSERRGVSPFLEVQLVNDREGGGATGAGGVIEVALPGGALARIGPDVGEEHLRRLLRVVGVPC